MYGYFQGKDWHIASLVPGRDESGPYALQRVGHTRACGAWGESVPRVRAAAMCLPVGYDQMNLVMCIIAPARAAAMCLPLGYSRYTVELLLKDGDEKLLYGRTGAALQCALAYLYRTLTGNGIGDD